MSGQGAGKKIPSTKDDPPVQSTTKAPKSSKPMPRKYYSEQSSSTSPQQSDKILEPLTTSKIQDHQPSRLSEANESQETPTPSKNSNAFQASPVENGDIAGPSNETSDKEPEVQCDKNFRRQKFPVTSNCSPWTPIEEDCAIHDDSEIPCYRRQKFPVTCSPWTPVEGTCGNPHIPLIRCKITESPTAIHNARTAARNEGKEQLSMTGGKNQAQGTEHDGKERRPKGWLDGDWLDDGKGRGHRGGVGVSRGDGNIQGGGVSEWGGGSPGVNDASPQTDEGEGTSSRKNNSDVSVFSLGLPPIVRKVFPYYPYGLIKPKCKNIVMKDRRKKKQHKLDRREDQPWSDALKTFYDAMHDGVDHLPELGSALPDEVAEGEKSSLSSSDRASASLPTEGRKKSIEEIDDAVKTRMTDLQALFDAEMKALTETYENVKNEPDPAVDEKIEEEWVETKHDLHNQIDECMDDILEDIKATHQ